MQVRAQSSVARAECTAGSAATVVPWNVAAAKSVGSVVPIGELESVDLLAARGRILAGNVTAILPSPPFDMSAMDGYAVRLDALDGPAPWRVPIAGRIAAGDPVAPTHGAVWQMLTGARVPEGFDAVVMQEHCVVDDGSIILSEQPTAGRNIRKTGEDVHLGDPLHRRGERITSRMLGLLASQGLFKVNVVRKVRIALVSTGSELVEPGAQRAGHQIFNSNRIMLRAALAACEWADVVDFGIIPDDRNTIASVLKEAAAACDAVLTTGGVSAGDADHVAGAMLDRGGSFELLKVAMRPGKPVKIGKLDGRLFLGLPGNPNAALVTFRMIAMPALRRLAGLNNVDPQWSRAVSDFRYEKPLGRTEFIPVRRLAGHGSHDLLRMLGRGSTASLRSLAEADGIALLPPDLSCIEKGASLRYEAAMD